MAVKRTVKRTARSRTQALRNIENARALGISINETLAGPNKPLTMEQFEAEQRQAKRFSQDELDAAIDRDRIKGFMLFARALPPGEATLVYGTSLQAKSIMRALAKAGY